MASTTAHTHLVSAPAPMSATTRTVPAYLAPAVAGALGALAAVATTWWIVATQTLQMSF